MRLADDTLIAIIGMFRKGLTEGTDISELLRQLDLAEGEDGKLKLSQYQVDVWSD